MAGSPKEGITRRAFLGKAIKLGAAAEAARRGLTTPLVTHAAPLGLGVLDSRVFQEDESIPLEARELIRYDSPFNPVSFVGGRGPNAIIHGSTIQPGVPAEITGSITFVPGEAGTFSGIMCTNQEQAGPDETALFLRRATNGTLSLQHRYPGGGEQYSLGRVGENMDFALEIAEDGMVVRVTTPEQATEVQLPESLFSRDEHLRLMAITNGGSEVQISRLSLAQPQIEGVVPPGEPLRALAQGRGISIGTLDTVRRPTYDARYEALLANQFNHVVTGGDFNWGVVRPRREQYNLTRADQIVNLANANNMDVYGQHLVWHVGLPQWLEQGDFSRDEVISIMQEHISELMGRYRGKISQWVVVNEAVADDPGRLYTDNFWHRKIGPEYIELAFEAAREADPDAILLYNDYGYEGGGTKADKVFDVVRNLKAKGLVDGIGMQTHLNLRNMPNISAMRATMRRFQDLGLQVHITELDVDIAGAQGSTSERLQKQAQVFADVVNLALEMGCPRVTVWGFEDANSWLVNEIGEQLLGRKGEAPNLFADYQPKPSYFALQSVLA